MNQMIFLAMTLRWVNKSCTYVNVVGFEAIVFEC